MEFSGLKVTFILASLGVIACTNAAAIGDSLISLSYGDPSIVSQSNVELVREKREPEAEAEERGVILNHLHNHLHNHHHVGESGHHSQPSGCYKCGGGNNNIGATFAQASAGTISGSHGDHGGHGGLGSQSASHAASYNFGPISASFSASHSTGQGGFGGGFF